MSKTTLKPHFFFGFIGLWLSLSSISCDSGGSDSPQQPTLIVTPFFLSDGFVLETYVEEINLPTSLAFAPDGSERLFINELQTGNIRIVESGNLLPESFATVPTFSFGNFPTEGENGLVGIAFDPDYVNNKYVYVSYARRDQEDTLGVIARYTDVNNQGTDFTVLLDSIPSSVSHQLQSIRFGPDRKLYAAVSDAHKPELAQDTSTLHGSIIRLNSDGSIPADNPFPNSYIYAYGFRNVYDFVFDEQGRLLAPDIGALFEDELNLVEPGANYGWPLFTGINNEAGFVDPIHVWIQGVVPTGLEWYRANTYPERYRNALFITYFGETFAEGPSNRAKRIQFIRFNTFDQPVLQDFISYNLPTRGNPLDLTVGPDGYIYFSDLFRGKIYRITYTDQN